jgi:hypothetical protein
VLNDTVQLGQGFELYYSLVCSFGLIDFEGSSLAIYWLEV